MKNTANKLDTKFALEVSQTQEQAVDTQKNEAIRSFNQKIEQSERKIRSLEEAIDTSSSLPLAVRTVLNEPRLEGIHDAVAKLMETEKRYTEALSVAG